MNAHIKEQKAFTLIELLTVIAIIAVLTAVLIPTAGKAVHSARKAKASSNLRQIALAYMIYGNTQDKPKSINKNKLAEWAAELAEQVDFNDPKIWILKEDPLVEQSPHSFPQTIIALLNEESHRWAIDRNFENFPLSFAVANGLSTQAPQASTPIAWTRGLKASGQWAPLTDHNPGVYGNQGGHIAFLDAHVSWYSELNSDNSLVHYLTRKPTSNILQALSPHASVLDYRGKIPSNIRF